MRRVNQLSPRLRGQQAHQHAKPLSNLACTLAPIGAKKRQANGLTG